MTQNPPCPQLSQPYHAAPHVVAVGFRDTSRQSSGPQKRCFSSDRVAKVAPLPTRRQRKRLQVLESDSEEVEGNEAATDAGASAARQSAAVTRAKPGINDTPVDSAVDSANSSPDPATAVALRWQTAHPEATWTSTLPPTASAAQAERSTMDSNLQDAGRTPGGSRQSGVASFAGASRSRTAASQLQHHGEGNASVCTHARNCLLSFVCGMVL